MSTLALVLIRGFVKFRLNPAAVDLPRIHVEQLQEVGRSAGAR